MILARGAELVRLGVLALRRQRSQVRILSGAPKSLPLQNKSGHQWRGLPLRKAHRKPAPISAVGDDRPDYPREKFRSPPQVALVSTGCAIHRYPRVRRGASAYLPQISFALVWIQDSLVRSGEPNHGCDGRVWGEECREHYQTRFREGFGADCRRCGTQN